MLTKYLHNFLTAPTANKSSLRMIFWFSLSLTFAAIYGILALKQAFSSEYVVQDDARQHVFWMRRFLDAGLFPNDLIADYFQSVAPLGYSAVYQIGAIGIDPIKLSKLLPVVLGLLTTGYCFGVCVQLLPVPMTGFIGAMLLNQNLWMQDGLISATPKAFLYPLFLAFLYYLLQSSLIPCLVAIALLGLFYPSLVFVCACLLILRVCRWHKFRLSLSQNRTDQLFCGAGLAVALLVLLPYTLGSSEFAPVITAAEARILPEFATAGRASFFNNDDPWEFWFNASRSGVRLPPALMPPLVYAGFLLPILLRYPSRFPLSKISSGVMLLPQLILASFVMFFTAHALLFKLHLPSRYTQHSLRIVMVTAAAVALTLMLDAIFAWVKDIQKTSLAIRLLPLATCLLVGTTLILYPSTLKSFLWTGYTVGGVPDLYNFFQQQPKDIVIASLADEVNNLPTFSQRSILVGSEYAVPYHQGYYRKFRKRSLELIQAQYSQDLTDVQQLIKKYGIDFWLLDRAAFTPEYVASDRWIQQYQPLATQAIAQMQQGVPALSKITQCSVFATRGLVVLEADCITKQGLGEASFGEVDSSRKFSFGDQGKLVSERLIPPENFHLGK